MKKPTKPSKELNRLKITIKGKDLPFREYAREIGGTPDLYKKEIREILMSWRRADRAYVDDYIAPLAAEVITDCQELNPELYQNIMKLVEEAYHLNRVAIDPGHPILSIIK